MAARAGTHRSLDGARCRRKKISWRRWGILGPASARVVVVVLPCGPLPAFPAWRQTRPSHGCGQLSIGLYFARLQLFRAVAAEQTQVNACINPQVRRRARSCQQRATADGTQGRAATVERTESTSWRAYSPVRLTTTPHKGSMATSPRQNTCPQPASAVGSQSTCRQMAHASWTSGGGSAGSTPAHCMLRTAYAGVPDGGQPAS